MDEHNINNFCQFCLEEQSIRSQKVPIDREVKRKFHDLTALKAHFGNFNFHKPTKLNKIHKI